MLRINKRNEYLRTKTKLTASVLVAAFALGGCSSVGIGIGIPIPGLGSVSIGVNSAGQVNAGIGIGTGPVSIGIGGSAQLPLQTPAADVVQPETKK